MRKRDHARNKSFKTKLETDVRLYKRLRNETTKYLREARKTYFKQQLDKTKGNIMRKVLPSKSSNREIEKVTVDGQDITDPEQIANSFTSVAARVLPNPPQPCRPRQTSNDPSFRFHPVHETEVLNHLKSLKLGKAIRHDNIPSISIKITQSGIYKNLSKIINSSLHNGIFPTEWKIAKISPVFKCNPSNNRDNYRTTVHCITHIPIKTK